MAEAESAPDSGVSMREALGELYDQMQADSTPDETVPDEALVVEPDEPEAEAAEVEEPEEPEATGATAPKHWPADRRALFERADPEIQQAWLDRETEYERGIQAKASEAAQYRQAIEPVRQHIALRGMDEAAWMRQMAGYTLALENDAAGVIRAVAQQYGVDLGSLTGTQQTVDDEFVDPQVKTLREQLKTLERRIEESQQAAQQDRQSTQAQMIERFRDEKGADGNPVHPHFDAVMGDIMVLAQGYRSTGKEVPALADLYDRAVRLHPDLTSQTPEQKAKAAQVTDLDRAAKARRAKSAAARPSGGVVNGDQSKPRTLRDELSDLWDTQQRG